MDAEILYELINQSLKLDNLTPEEYDMLVAANSYVGLFVPKKVIRSGAWSPITCPTCGAELSYYIGDGSYEDRDWLQYCSNEKCHQKLDWSMD